MPYPINQRAHQLNLFLNQWRPVGCHSRRFATKNRSACCELDVVKYFRHQQVSNLKNALLNDLTAFGEERYRQSKRKLDVLVCGMKLDFYFFVMYWTLALSTVNVNRMKAIIGFWEWCVCLNLISYMC